MSRPCSCPERLRWQARPALVTPHFRLLMLRCIFQCIFCTWLCIYSIPTHKCWSCCIVSGIKHVTFQQTVTKGLYFISQLRSGQHKRQRTDRDDLQCRDWHQCRKHRISKLQTFCSNALAYRRQHLPVGTCRHRCVHTCLDGSFLSSPDSARVDDMQA